MPYGIIKLDTLVYTSGGLDASTSVSGLVGGSFNNISASGSVGIGVTQPTTWPLEVAKSQNSATLIQVGNFDAGSAAVPGFRAIGNSAKFADYKINAAFSLAQLVGGNGITALYYDFDTHVWRKNNGTEHARIDSSGRLLVGTSSAYTTMGALTAKLQVQGTSAFDTGITNVLWESSNNPAQLQLVKSRGASVGTHTVVQNNDNLGRILFGGSDGTDFESAAWIQCDVDGTPGTDDMPGRLVFSTTADGASSPTERMRITNNGQIIFFSAFSSILSSSAAAAGTTHSVFSGWYNATSTTASGTLSVVIYNNGNVLNTNNSYGALSDVKLKENIVDAGSQWNDLKALQVRKYNFKEGQTHTQIGLVAQEVELVSPGLVSESPDRDEDGNDLGTVTKSVNYSVLYMKAVKALQEAMERIETLEAKVAALESA